MELHPSSKVNGWTVIDLTWKATLDGMDGSLGGVKYRAPYDAKNFLTKQLL